MGARAEDGLFGALEIELKKAKQPMDCVALFEKASVREHAMTVNRVSDYLGHMWRKGHVLRLPAPRTENSRSRWLYVWKPRVPVKLPTIEEAMNIASVGTKLFSKPNIEITEEDGSVVITLPSWSITIKKTA